MYRLKIERGGPKGKTFDLREGSQTHIGRSRKADLQFTLPDVSGSHVRIEVKGGKALAENLSRFGTLLDGEPLEEPTPLKSGQRLALGMNTVLLVEEVPDIEETEEDEFVLLSHGGLDMHQFVQSKGENLPEDPFADADEEDDPIPTDKPPKDK